MIDHSRSSNPATTFMRVAVACVGLILGVSAACAQTYPSKPVRLIVPYPAGGAADLMARAVAERMSAAWAPVIVEPKPGANGNLAADYVSRLPGDGYAFLVASIFMTANPVLQNNVKWSHRSFVPVALIGGGPENVFVVPANSPFGTLKDLVRNAKSQPGKLNVGTPSLGSSNHLGLELFYSISGIEIFPVPYVGAPPAVPAVVRGDVAMSLLSAPMIAPYVRGEKMKALAVSSTRRSKAMPDVPTVGEAGFGDAALLPWFGIVAPLGTPRAVVAAVNAEVNKALASPGVIERMERIGAEILGGTPEDFERHIARESETVTRLIKERNIRAE